MGLSKTQTGLAAIVLAAALYGVLGDPGGITTARMATQDARLLAAQRAAQTDAARGAAYFVLGDWGGLSSDTLRTSASPWQLSTAVIALNAVDGDINKVSAEVVRAEFQRFGMTSPTTIANWPNTLPQPDFTDVPLGQLTGRASRAVPPVAVSIGNGSCAMCHSAVTYDADGAPDPSRVWIGGSNSSINLQAYVTALYEGFSRFGGEDEEARVFAALDRLYPDMTARDRWTLRLVILPEFRKTLAEREATIGSLLPFTASTAGATNGLDTLRGRLGLIPDGTRVAHSAFNSVPDLGGRLMRDRYLNTGVYRIPGQTEPRTIWRDEVTETHRENLAAIISYFTVPSLGVSPEVAVDHHIDANDVAAWMADYRPAPFPGRVDADAAERGADIYQSDCASCHGQYTEEAGRPVLLSFPNVATPDIGTDAKRLGQFTPTIAAAVNASAIGPYIDAAPTRSFSAPPLDGLWSSAPYLHNGSVPSLHALMNPDDRPARFTVGGHALDLDTVGIRLVEGADGAWRYPDDYRPWAQTEMIDTREWGLGNAGHEAQFAPLSDAQKSDLLEYLKRL